LDAFSNKYINMIQILKGIKYQHILIIIIVILGLGLLKARKEIIYQKSEKERQEDNFNNLLLLDSINTAQFKFKSTKELTKYINSNKKLEHLLQNLKIKYKKIENLAFINETHIDTIIQIHNTSPIIQYIKNDIAISEQWQDSSTCLLIKGSLDYKNDTLEIKVKERIWDNDIVIVGGWERKPWNFLGFKIRLFGKKVGTVTADSKCGKPKTITLEKVK